mmetsp:Transcript_16836/g.45580  ORF Transcript_16836/g.45580 Transcript_16836/m.45580 type:complete len:212 (-) Transcript_16836:1206-1841(-)
MFRPSRSTLPCCGSYVLMAKARIDDFPVPVGPTMAVVSPAGIVKESASTIFTSSFEGYAKDTLSNSILPDARPVERPSRSGMSDARSKSLKTCSILVPISPALLKPFPSSYRGTKPVSICTQKIIKSPVVICPSATRRPPYQHTAYMENEIETSTKNSMPVLYQWPTCSNNSNMRFSEARFLISASSRPNCRTMHKLSKVSCTLASTFALP